MDYLPNNATIDEACEWLHFKTRQKWTLPRLLEDGHLTPYVWNDNINGHPRIFGDKLEGYLTKMIYHGDVVRLAADRNEAVLTMYTAHDGSLLKPDPAWRVELKDIRFKKKHIERVAEIINSQKTEPDTATPAPVETVEQRRARYLALLEHEQKSGKRGALTRVASFEGVDRSNMSKDIEKARAARALQTRSGAWTAQLVQDGKRHN